MKKELKEDKDANIKLYDKFYKDGGWSHKPMDCRKAVARINILPQIGNWSSKKVLDIGCGMGQDASVIAEDGHYVTGIDLSSEGIEYAKVHFPSVKFICDDLAKHEFVEGEFDVIFSRGMSWYHYELSGINRNGVDVLKETNRLFKFLKKGGIFILGIATHFDGTVRPGGQTLNNKLEDYTGLFSQVGEIIHVSDWAGRKLKTKKDTEGRKNIYVITKKC